MDLFNMNALACELCETLYGAKTDKIVQPESDEIRFYLRRGNRNFILVISANAKVPRIHLTKQKKQNPINAPAFCMLLRKHLSIGAIENISILNNDRAIKIDFLCKSEMKDFKRFSIIVELMSRYSNIVFVDENYTILEAMKKTSLDVPNNHPILKGIKYSPLVRPKTSVFDDEFKTVIYDVAKQDGVFFDNFLSCFGGFKTSTLKYLFEIADVKTDVTNPSDDDIKRIIGSVEAMKNVYGSDMFKPCVSADGEPLCTPYGSKSYEFFETLSDAFDKSLNYADLSVRIQSKTKQIKQATKRLIEKLKKNIEICKVKLSECENMESERILGELITTNIYQIKRGMKEVTLYDYYANENKTIPLDKTLSPSQNANKHFEKYNKLKRAKEFTLKRIDEETALLDYAVSIDDSILNLKNEDSISEIENELAQIGALRIQKHSVKNEKPQPPIEYNVNGFTVYKGKNNVQNDFLTFKIANANDLWFHQKDAPSSHTVLLCRGSEPDDETLKIVAEIAISDKTASAEVDYTKRQNVKRKQPYHYGQVIYTDYKTIFATPNAHSELLIADSKKQG
ncbi:MAG: NFACT RNA binding domain-containing protein [Firmicutes bacterium]|nr:NFACT RNA binding domain-containing protein [Bacillota bacterium]